MMWLIALRIFLLAVALVTTFGNVAYTAHKINVSAARMLVMGFSWAGFLAAMGWLV